MISKCFTYFYPRHICYTLAPVQFLNKICMYTTRIHATNRHGWSVIRDIKEHMQPRIMMPYQKQEKDHSLNWKGLTIWFPPTCAPNSVFSFRTDAALLHRMKRIIFSLGIYISVSILIWVLLSNQKNVPEYPAHTTGNMQCLSPKCQKWWQSVNCVISNSHGGNTS